ncbi:MAG: precorrin-6y C5,15-methyltransferase (decarboxylating) subunit CbiE [Proteobacteria bacterium]|nr:precorrin-6y C5,15-methyltransferase (decarboxylating) subunit CbiE [Pseudomonadota bacterium]
MHKIFVIGVADSQLSTSQEMLLQGCALIVGAQRYAELVTGFSDRYVKITPLDGALAALRNALPHGNVAVLASGDPLFFGIGRKLLDEFPEQKIDFIPALSSVQRACALFRIPWDDATITSLHGRAAAHLPGLLLGHGKHLLLTDATNSPDRIASQLLDYLTLIGETELPRTIKMLVAENMSLASEKIFHGSLAEATKKRFSTLNIICLLIPGLPACPSYRFGLTEDLLHHSRGLITKNEVRAATLHRLCLPDTGVLWDVGAGSGSLSIEAARANPKLTVYAVEQKEAELENIKNNIVKFRCFNIVPVPGRAPEALAELPDPQRVFIGGSSGALPAIVLTVAARLALGGILVINGVVDKTVQAAPELMRGNGFNVSTSTVQVSRTDSGGNTKDFNPITIMTGTR